MLTLSLSLVAAAERPSAGPGWAGVELALVVVVPCSLLCVAVLLGVLTLQSQRCSYRRANKQDPEVPLEDLVMSPDKCLKELIYDMSTSGSGSGR